MQVAHQIQWTKSAYKFVYFCVNILLIKETTWMSAAAIFSDSKTKNDPLLGCARMN